MARIYGKRFDGKVFEIQNWSRSKTPSLPRFGTETLPSLGSSSPLRMFSNVVLPEPFAPTNP